MNCGNCGKGNEYGAKICVHCGSTLALTEYFRRKGFVEKKDPPKKAKEEPWDQEILTTGYRSKHRRPQEEQESYHEDREAGGQGRSNSPGNSRTRRGEANAPKSGGSRQGDTSSRGNGSSRRSGSSRQSGTATRQSGSSASRGESTTGQRKARGRTASGRERNKSGEPTRGSKAPRTETQKDPARGTEKPKKIPKSKVYNHTTKSLSLAEKEVKKKTGKKERNPRKWILSLAVVLVILIVAAGIFIGTMHFSSDEDHYTEAAEAFVRAMVMDDEETLAGYVHPKMHGTLTPLGYEGISRCDTKIVEYQEVEALEIEQELHSRYGITDPVRELYRVHVGCTIYGEGSYAFAIDVFMAEIDGNIYAVKTENISKPAGT